MNIANIIRCECLPLELAVKCTDNDINALLQNLDGQILWIFDDYDSVAECEAASPMGKLLSSLLEKSPRILTSRPGFINQVLMNVI
ncbi:MAG: hypothetical protein HWD59_00940 [Coxiellaceae bacterium]|nr:MAG: hypothetical protein HWD59_00940 [Coxiellaceae bacterium]